MQCSETHCVAPNVRSDSNSAFDIQRFEAIQQPDVRVACSSNRAEIRASNAESCTKAAAERIETAQGAAAENRTTVQATSHWREFYPEGVALVEFLATGGGWASGSVDGDPVCIGERRRTPHWPSEASL